MEAKEKHEPDLYSFIERKISFQMSLIAPLIIKGIRRVKKCVCSLTSESVDSCLHEFWFVIRLTPKAGKVISHFIEA